MCSRGLWVYHRSLHWRRNRNIGASHQIRLRQRFADSIMASAWKAAIRNKADDFLKKTTTGKRYQRLRACFLGPETSAMPLKCFFFRLPAPDSRSRIHGSWIIIIGCQSILLSLAEKNFTAEDRLTLNYYQESCWLKYFN